MARTRTSLFCARCKRVLADIVASARDEGYPFPGQDLLNNLFNNLSVQFEEGYIYALSLLVGLEERINNEEDLQKFVEVAVTTERPLKGDEEWTGFKQSLMDGTVVFLNDHGASLRGRLTELIFHYFTRIGYKYPYHPELAPTEVRRDEIDEICMAVTRAAEKV